MLPVLTSTMPSTVVSTTFLAARVANSPCAAVDALLIALGLLLTVVPVAMLSYLAFNIADRWKCATKKNKDEAHDGERRNHTLKALRTFVHNATQRLWKWRAVIPSDTESMRPAWIVLLEYRVLSYAAIDALFLVAVSSLAVVGGLDVTNEALCRGCSAAVVVLLGAQVGALCAWRPYTTLFSLVYNVATTALTCLSVAAQLAFVVTSFTSTSGLWLVDASAVCNLLVLGLSVVKMLLDAWELWSAVRRRVHSACGCEAASVDDIQSEEFIAMDAGIDAWDEREDSTAPINAAPNSLLDVEEEEEAAGTIAFDDLFWDDDGQAIGTSEAEDMNEILTTVVKE